MRDIRPWFQAKRISLRQKSARAAGRNFDPYPAPPAGVRLSPSLWHSQAMADVAVAMAWSKTDDGDATVWQQAARKKLEQFAGIGDYILYYAR